MRYPIHEFDLRKSVITALAALLLVSSFTNIRAQSLGIPSSRWGISFGNSKNFTGLRFNMMDNDIEKINGINITFWKPRNEHISGTVNGLSLGIMPSAANLHGIQLGIAGVGAGKDMKGISIGLLGAGSGGDMIGINIGGLGAGAGATMGGVNIGLLGCGAGEDMWGINIGGLGAGAGKNMTGLNIGAMGVGAGNNVSGITLAGLGAGAGNTISGLIIAGLGAGAPTVKGIAVAGLGVGGNSIQGIAIALGHIRIDDDKTGDAELRGFACSAFNYIKGRQTGLSIGIVNYAYSLKGVQIGLINIVRDNPKLARILPLINVHF